jgi:hypothetical protein
MPDVGRNMEAHMTAAATKVENARRRMAADEFDQMIEVSALRMDGARDIGRRAGAELAADEL